MTRRSILHQRFYAFPTLENYKELNRVLQSAVVEHIMTKELSDYIIYKAKIHLQEQGIQSKNFNLNEDMN